MARFRRIFGFVTAGDAITTAAACTAVAAVGDDGAESNDRPGEVRTIGWAVAAALPAVTVSG